MVNQEQQLFDTGDELGKYIIAHIPKQSITVFTMPRAKETFIANARLQLAAFYDANNFAAMYTESNPKVFTALAQYMGDTLLHKRTPNLAEFNAKLDSIRNQTEPKRSMFQTSIFDQFLLRFLSQRPQLLVLRMSKILLLPTPLSKKLERDHVSKF